MFSKARITRFNEVEGKWSLLKFIGYLIQESKFKWHNGRNVVALNGPLITHNILFAVECIIIYIWIV